MVVVLLVVTLTLLIPDTISNVVVVAVISHSLLKVTPTHIKSWEQLAFRHLYILLLLYLCCSVYSLSPLCWIALCQNALTSRVATLPLLYCVILCQYFKNRKFDSWTFLDFAITERILIWKVFCYLLCFSKITWWDRQTLAHVTADDAVVVEVIFHVVILYKYW